VQGSCRQPSQPRTAGPGKASLEDKAMVLLQQQDLPQPSACHLIPAAFARAGLLRLLIPTDPHLSRQQRQNQRKLAVHLKAFCIYSEFLTAHVEPFVLLQCERVRGYAIALDVQKTPRALWLLLISTNRGSTAGQEGLAGHGHPPDKQGVVLHSTAFCTSDVFKWH